MAYNGALWVLTSRRFIYDDKINQNLDCSFFWTC
jgi:hypothetical protein